MKGKKKAALNKIKMEIFIEENFMNRINYKLVKLCTKWMM